VSRAARRYARRQHRRNQVGQIRERTLSVPLDEQWVQSLRRISDRIAANVRECRSIAEATAELLDMTGDDAAELLGRYVDCTDDDGLHPDGLLGWLTTTTQRVPGIDTPTGDTPAGERHVPRTVPLLTVTVDYPPGWSPLAEEGAVVTVPFLFARDPEGRLQFDVRVAQKSEDFSEWRARALMTASVNYLRKTWSKHARVLEAMADSKTSNIDNLLVDEDRAVNARGGAA
jgi:hypothetical protein